jgi:hypothetical protein
LDLPTAQFDDSGSVRNACGDVSRVGMQGFDLSVCQVIFVQIGDVLEQLQANFCYALVGARHTLVPDTIVKQERW